MFSTLNLRAVDTEHLLGLLNCMANMIANYSGVEIAAEKLKDAERIYMVSADGTARSQRHSRRGLQQARALYNVQVEYMNSMTEYRTLMLIELRRFWRN